MMSLNLTPFFVLWVLLALSLAALVVKRKLIANQEDDSLHVLQGSVAQQVSVAQKLEVIDKWGKILTIVTVAVGAILVLAWVYQTYVTASTTSGM
jgi:hypothetical protein